MSSHAGEKCSSYEDQQTAWGFIYAKEQEEGEDADLVTARLGVRPRPCALGMYISGGCVISVPPKGPVQCAVGSTCPPRWIETRLPAEKVSPPQASATKSHVGVVSVTFTINRRWPALRLVHVVHASTHVPL
jgi:hypothetical protein